MGDVYGFAGDATHLYFTSWQLYGSRGNLGKVRKDGEGLENLTSLLFEPRSLVSDEAAVYYSEGIRLMKLSKAEGKAVDLASQFSSLNLALDAANVYGVPGEYGPYDRLVRVPKQGGVNFELDVATRPEGKPNPVGYNGIAVDGKGVYVTDSGGNRVLKFPLERGKPRILAKGQAKAFDLVIDSSNVYFTLAEKGHLMRVPKAGGTAKVFATGLVPKSRIAADELGIVAAFAGPKESDPVEIAKLSTDGTKATLATLAASYSVEAIAIDKECAYWVAHPVGPGAAEFYAVAR